MSIILKGIDLPSKGKTVTIDIDSEGTVWMSNKGEWEKYRAIQIPKEHGRLIDEKKVENERYYIHEPYYSYPVIRWGSLHRVPTILEAEE